MQCQICNRNFAEYQCSKCGRLVCSDCESKPGGKVLCKNCFSQERAKSKRKEVRKETDIKSSIKGGILTLMILLGGMLFITYYLRNYLSAAEIPFDAEPIIAIIDAFGSILIFGIGFILLMLVIALAILARR